jgi:hypothetical protein
LLAPGIELFATIPEWSQLGGAHPKLSAWLARMQARPSLQSTTWERVAAPRWRSARPGGGKRGSGAPSVSNGCRDSVQVLRCRAAAEACRSPAPRGYLVAFVVLGTSFVIVSESAGHRSLRPPIPHPADIARGRTRPCWRGHR